jgi:hypothetical protein
MDDSIIHLSYADPVVLADEERKRLNAALSGLPDGDEADAVVHEISEFEDLVFSRPAQTEAGLKVQLELILHWMNPGVYAGRDTPGVEPAITGLRDWARGAFDGPGGTRS